MAHPVGFAYGFAVLMVSVSVYCIGRLALASRLKRRNHIDVNVAHVLMGAAMVGMLVPRWNVVPNGLWELVFGVIALHFLAQTIRIVAEHGLRGIDEDRLHHISHYMIHMVMACAMLYMYWLGMPNSGSGSSSMVMSGSHARAGDPILTLFLVAVLLASAIWQLDSISVKSSYRVTLSTVGAAVGTGDLMEPAGGDERPWLAPRLEVGCHIAMCLTMAYMLVLMV
jgi:hypothetical protein